MIGVIFQKELMLIKQKHQMHQDICHNWYFLDKIFYEPFLWAKVAIVSITRSDYRIYF